MQIWVGGRAWGKTTRLIEYMEGHPDTHMVSVDPGRVSALTGASKERFLTLRQALEPGHRRKLLIDDLDLMLPRIFAGNEVHVATATGVMVPKPVDYDEWADKQRRQVGEERFTREYEAQWTRDPFTPWGPLD